MENAKYISIFHIELWQLEFHAGYFQFNLFIIIRVNRFATNYLINRKQIQRKIKT